MIIIYLGRRGAGKTLSMVKDAYIYYMEGRRVISNMEGISFAEFKSNDEIKAIDKNSDIDNCVLLIDELQIFFDSRRSMTKGNINFSNFVQQIRKRGVIILGTTQFSNSIDRRLRDHTDIICYPTFHKKYNVCELTYMDMTSIQDVGIEEYDTVKTFYNAQDIFNLYNTNEMVK